MKSIDTTPNGTIPLANKTPVANKNVGAITQAPVLVVLEGSNNTLPPPAALRIPS